ncbi:MAG: ABC transporter ATP-binding protein [Kiritimatiellae bacterium]|jgi:ABC-2 type transport system ATP-binding protein|nr:ABC transporter ATP-binding protein [Kiritimatiellia bacterium]
MLNIDHISFSYGNKQVLKDITFDVAPGEIVAIVGANGAGKTTLLRILSFVLMQDAGNVVLDGVDPLQLPVKYRKWIGYLSERCPLYEEMTVEQFLRYRLRLKGERALRERRRLTVALELCDLEDVKKSEIKLLSQGFKKRIGLADAVMLHPRLILLDDPLASLDIGHRKQIGTALTSLSAHSAVILAGHEISEMLDWCTRFIVLKDGEIEAFYRTGEFDRAELKHILTSAVSARDEEGEL